MDYTLIEHDGLKMIVYGPFSNARTEVEKYTAIVKQTHKTQRCGGMNNLFTFILKRKINVL